MSSRWITSVEKREQDDLIIYWCGTDAEPKEFGITFRGSHQNIHRDGTVESILLTLGMAEHETENW